MSADDDRIKVSAWQRRSQLRLLQLLQQVNSQLFSFKSPISLTFKTHRWEDILQDAALGSSLLARHVFGIFGICALGNLDICSG